FQRVVGRAHGPPPFQPSGRSPTRRRLRVRISCRPHATSSRVSRPANVVGPLAVTTATVERMSISNGPPVMRVGSRGAGRKDEELDVMSHRQEYTSLGRRVRVIREGLYGEDVGEIAEALKLPCGTWQNYESGVMIPAPVILEFIVLTGASPRWLLNGEGDRY